MSYTPTTWQTGDTVTAEKLNNMENGIEKNCAFEVPIYHTSTLYEEGWQDDYYVPAEYADDIYEKIWDHPAVQFVFYDVFNDGVTVRKIITVQAKKITYDSLQNNYFVTSTDKAETMALRVIQAGEKFYNFFSLSGASYSAGSDWFVYPDTVYNSDFVVALTPTGLDFSGTMNKTPVEIYNAYNAGMRIVFSIPSMDAVVIPQQFKETGSAVICGGQIVYYYNETPILINIGTSTSSQTYSTELYQLTPFT